MQQTGIGGPHGGSNGLHVLAALVGAYAAGAALQRPAVFGMLLSDYLNLGARASLVVILARLGVTLYFRPAGSAQDVTTPLVRRLCFGLCGVVLFAAGLAAFSTYKLMIPSVMPFPWDAPFDALDRLVHGTAPWELTHALLPRGLADFIGALYGIPWFLYWFGTLGYVVFCAGEPLRSRYLWGLGLTIIVLGTGAATLFASHGPIFFPHFGLEGYADLPIALRQTELGRGMLASADYLYSAFTSGEAHFGSGISAMPSMHVGIVVLNLCFYWALDRRLGIAAAYFALLISIGSVHFGWHYAIDAYASMVAVPLLWWLAGRLQRAFRKPSALVEQPGLRPAEE